MSLLTLLVRHWPWKLLALVLSYAIWLAVVGESRIVQDVGIPIDLALANHLVLAEPAPTTVLARLRGPENQLRRADLLRISYPVDLHDASPGAVNVQLDASELRGVPSGIEVVFVEPDRLSLTLDERRRRTVPVVPAFRGQPPAGYAFYGAGATPEAKEIEGPAGQVNALQRLRTDPIPLDGRTESFHVRARAVPDSREVRLLDSVAVDVRVEVDRAPVQRTVTVPVDLGGARQGTTVSPTSVRVTVAGPPALLERLAPGQVRAMADVEGVAPGTGLRNLPLRTEFREVPAGDLGRLSVVQVDPASVLVQTSGKESR